MNIRTLSVNSILAALYLVVSLLIQPIGFGPIQLRIPEMLNHLVVFNKKYMFGIVFGVFIANLLLSPFKTDLIFGTGQSLLSLSLTILCSKFVQSEWKRMAVNTVIFTFSMCIIAWQIVLLSDIPVSFMLTWGTTALGEFAVMAVGIPVMTAINKRVKFEKLV